MKGRAEDYYLGYFAALQDVSRELEEEDWDESYKITEGLIQAAVRNIIREAQEDAKKE